MHVALLQCDPLSAESPEQTVRANLTRLQQFAAQAANARADILVTPELFLSGYDIGVQATHVMAQAERSTALDSVADIARENNIAIVLGYARKARRAHAPRVAAGNTSDVLHNAAALFDRNGQIQIQYDKTHLFGQTDKTRFDAGPALSETVQLQTAAGQISVALAICYDIEFPEVARKLALNGAQLILVPTANMQPYESVPQRLVPSRAEENGVFVAYANYCGAEGQYCYTGLSCICAPDGTDLARAGHTTQLLIAEVDVAQIAAVRGAADYLRERRTDLYTND